MPIIIDGKQLSSEVCSDLEKILPKLNEHNINPFLVVIIVGNNPASEIYVKNKVKKAKKMGLRSELLTLPEDISKEELLKKIDELNNDTQVSGILLQLPLPKKLEAFRHELINKIDYRKDVDGLTYKNIGYLAASLKSAFVPCTALGSYLLLKKYVKDIKGKDVLIIGRSDLVGKPLFHLLLRQNATVTLAHSRTKNLAKHIKNNEIICVATGVPSTVKAEDVTDQHVIIDVGINRIISDDGSKKIIGDVEPSAYEKSSFFTPVPGGVGPMTVAMLMYNTIYAEMRKNNFGKELIPEILQGINFD